jgi:hypothetical protein
LRGCLIVAPCVRPFQPGIVSAAGKKPSSVSERIAPLTKLKTDSGRKRPFARVL